METIHLGKYLDAQSKENSSPATTAKGVMSYHREDKTGQIVLKGLS